MSYNYENLTLEEIFIVENESCFLHNNLFKNNKNLSIDYLISHLENEEIIYVAYNKYCPKEFIDKYYSLKMLEKLFLNELEYDYEKPYGPYHDLNPLLHQKINLDIVDKFYFINRLNSNHEIFKNNNRLYWNFDKLSYNENLTSEFIKKYPEEKWNRNRIIFFL
jgi:hypothetical protein